MCREEKHEQSKTLELLVGKMSSGSVGSGEWKKSGKSNDHNVKDLKCELVLN